MVIYKMTDDQVSFQKLLIDWWTEETEYLLQRIERWTLPRRYNKLHSPRISRGRLTMQKNQNDDYTWNYSSSTIDSPKSSQKNFTSLDEIRKINCCRTFYQSNDRFDSSCLENYRYDHSIYFKTIGDIKNSKNKNELNDQDQTKSLKDSKDCNYDFVAEIADDDFKDILDRPAPIVNLNPDQCWYNYSHFNVDNNNNDDNNKINNNNKNNNNNGENDEADKVCKIWPIVDIENLANYKNNRQEEINYDDNFNNNDHNDVNEQYQDQGMHPVQLSSTVKNQDRLDMMRFLSLRKTKRPKTPQKSVVYGDNNISWPRVLFSYNIDSTLAASHHRTLNVK